MLFPISFPTLLTLILNILFILLLLLFPSSPQINSFLLSEIISEVNNILSDIIVEYKYIYKKTEDILYCALVLKKDFQSWSSTVKNNIIAILGKKTNGNINLKLNISTESLFKCNVIKGRLLEVVD